MTDTPRVVNGGLAADDRGQLQFINDLDVSAYRRFYVISNHRAGFVRAWHGHQFEGKAIAVLRGAAVVGAVKVDDWENPDPNAEVHRVALSGSAPKAFIIPPGHANGIMSLTDDALIFVFSSSSLEESAGDDIRLPSRLWDIWNVEER